jgi:opacity protein-like surface antigen
MAGAGIYVGLGAGWDGQTNTNVDQLAPPPATGQLTTDDGLIIAGTLGYKLPEIPIRLEFESGYDWHKISTFETGGASFAAGGHANVASELFNATYDFPVGPGWNIYGGGGVGVGHVWFAPFVAATGDQIAQTNKWGFMWQGIVGTSFELAPDAEVFVDYRYRGVDAQETTNTAAFGPVESHNIHENVVMAGVRFYMFPPVVAYGAPPPPAYYAPPPPPAYAPPPPPAYAPPPPAAGSGGASSGGAGGSPP